MEIGTTLKVTKRKDWRNWLQENHQSKKEIWLVFYLKDSGKPFLPYDEAVEEALCFGWIDSIIKKLEADSRAQRFTPRNPKSNLSELNKERVRRMIKAGKMTPAGLERIKKHLVSNEKGELKPIPFVMPEDIIKRLKKDPVVWENFQNFPDYYKNIRIGFIDNARERPDVFEKRLAYFIKMTAENKRFGSLT
jgi:uncharacterized protein YdeI (YjbR/CyaY-like superfamily)